jgi:hypothetical protein
VTSGLDDAGRWSAQDAANTHPAAAAAIAELHPTRAPYVAKPVITLWSRATSVVGLRKPAPNPTAAIRTSDSAAR